MYVPEITPCSATFLQSEFLFSCVSQIQSSSVVVKRDHNLHNQVTAGTEDEGIVLMSKHRGYGSPSLL